MARVGIDLHLKPEHPFVVAESVRWARAIEAGLAHVAVDQEGQPVGSMVLCFVDRAPYLDQLSATELHQVLALQRAALPISETRVAMVSRGGGLAEDSTSV